MNVFRLSSLAEKILKSQLKLAAIQSYQEIVPKVEEKQQKIESKEEEEEESYSSDESMGIIDVSSPEFNLLPEVVKQEILIKMRQRRKDFTDPTLYDSSIDTMEFSKIQIKNVVKRNAVTAMMDKLKENSGRKVQRLASDSNKEYMLIKNPKQIGWTLGNTEELDDHENEEFLRVQTDSFYLEIGAEKEDFTKFMEAVEPSFSDDEEITSKVEDRKLEIKETRIFVKKEESIIKKESTLDEPFIAPGNEPSEEGDSSKIYSDSSEEESALQENEQFAGRDLTLEEHKQFVEKKEFNLFDEKEETTRFVELENNPPENQNISLPPSDEESSTESLDSIQGEEAKRLLTTEDIEEIANLSDPEDFKSKINLLQEDIQIMKRTSGTLERYIAGVDRDITEDVIELLEILGLPYVIGPAEAEAQCSFLQRNGLVDGIATDDSDSLVFGGDMVYRHLFTPGKETVVYQKAIIESKLGFDTAKLIDLAQLLGCDYCVGVKGIGPVKAQLLLNHFSSLQQVDAWIEGAAIDSKLDAAVLKLKDLIQKPTDNPQVRYAFENPEVSTDLQAFEWKPFKMDQLQRLLTAKLKWQSDYITKYFDKINRAS